MILCEARKCSNHPILIIVGTLFSNEDHTESYMDRLRYCDTLTG